MKRNDTPLPFPRRGVNENWAFKGQPLATTSDAANMRSVDGTNGRTRGSSREGMSKHYAYAAGSPIRVVHSLVYTNKTITYEALEGELDSFGDGRGKVEELWAKHVDPKGSVFNTETDEQGNLYLLLGKILEKRNPDGQLLWSFELPIENELFTLGPLAIGPDLGVHIGVDGGASGHDGAAIYRVRQKQLPNSFDTEPVLEWTETVNAWVRELRNHKGTLKALLQDDIAGTAWIQTFSDITGAVPTITAQIRCPYPATCMVVKEDGSLVTGHPYHENRDSLPLFPGVGVGLVSWRPEDIKNYKTRVWARHSAESLDNLSHKDSITLLPDTTGNGRNYGPGTPRGGSLASVPTYNEHGSLGVPCLDFDGTQGLFSAPGGGKDSQRGANKAAIPNHGDGAYCTMIVCRPASQQEPDETDGAGVAIDYRRYLFEHRHHVKFGTSGGVSTGWDVGPTGAYISGMILNSGTTGVPPAADDLHCWGKSDSMIGSAEPGKARAFTQSSGKRTASALVNGTTDWENMPQLKGASDYGWPKAGSFDDPTTDVDGDGITVFTFMHCGGLDEAIVVDGSIVNTAGLDVFTATDPNAFHVWRLGNLLLADIGGTGYLDGVSYGAAVITSRNVVTFAVAPGVSGTLTLSFVPSDRNFMTRSCFRINGKPIDRWEALPMSFRGVNVDPGTAAGLKAEGYFQENVASTQTGLGLPAIHSFIKGFVGEIYEIVTFGRRQSNSEMVTLGGAKYHVYPTVLTVPLNAENQFAFGALYPTYAPTGAQEQDTPYDAITSGAAVTSLSTEVEKLEGYLAHKWGAHKRLETSGTYKHPHYPGTDVPLPEQWDVPLAPVISSVPAASQAWPPRRRKDAAMILKQDPAGNMLWCLLSEIVFTTGTVNGDIVRYDIDGAALPEYPTLARCTGGLAIGLEDDIFAVGPGAGANSDEYCVVRIVDDIQDDSNPLIVSYGWWRTTSPAAINSIGFQTDQTIRCKSDEYGNLHIPIIPGTKYLGSSAVEAVRSFSRDGLLLARLSTLNHGTVSFQNAYALALPPVNPEYYI